MKTITRDNMEKAATYTVLSPPHPCKRSWVSVVAVGMSLVALGVACVAAAVVVEQASLVGHLEGRIMEMETHIEDILRLTIANHEYDYVDYDDDYDYQDDGDQQEGHSEGITVRRVVRRRRQTNTVDNELSELPNPPNVPVYDRAYGIDLKTQTAAKGLRLYDSLWDDPEEEAENENSSEVTDSPIKPHHRISNLWVPKKRRQRLPSSSGPPNLSSRTVVRQADSTDGEGNELVDNFSPSSSELFVRSSRLTQRKSRTKSLHGSRRELKRQQKQRVRSNQPHGSVVYRRSHVKATDRHDGFSRRNNNVVVPRVTTILQGVPKKVHQEVSGAPVAVTRAPTGSYGKKRKLRNKQHRRRRRARPIITLAHFAASTSNTTTQQGHASTREHLEWTPAAWMDKLGLNSKYSLQEGTVTVKEPGLYYLYAQVLYESGRSGGGFQVLVDDTPTLECQLPALRPAPTCLTGGLTYLPRNAKVKVRDLDNNLVTVRQHQSTFFGMVKLMDARYTAREMLLA